MAIFDGANAADIETGKLAESKGSTKDVRAMAKLRGLSGKEFDRAFFAHEVAFHTAVIAAVTNTLLPAIKNAELNGLVVKVAPAFEAHRKAAEEKLKSMQ